MHNARWAVRWHRLETTLPTRHPRQAAGGGHPLRVLPLPCCAAKASWREADQLSLAPQLASPSQPTCRQGGLQHLDPGRGGASPGAADDFCVRGPRRAQSEVIGAFSHSCRPWAGGGAGEDALTWYAAPHSDGFSFRTRMFDWTRGFVRGTRHCNRVRLLHARWHLVEVRAQREAPDPALAHKPRTSLDRCA